MRGDIIKTPKNVATKVRKRVTLDCAGGVDDKMQWTAPLTGTPISVRNEIVNQSKDTFSLNTDGGQFALIIKSPVLSDGTTYRCKDIYESNAQHGDAEVIVFGKTYFPIFH